MSALEDEFARQVTEAGLPPFLREYVFSPPRRWRIDFMFLPHKVAVEVMGGTWARMRHTRGQGYEQDCEKANQAALNEILLLRVTAEMVKDGRALVLVKRALNYRAFALEQKAKIDELLGNALSPDLDQSAHDHAALPPGPAAARHRRAEARGRAAARAGELEREHQRGESASPEAAPAADREPAGGP